MAVANVIQEPKGKYNITAIVYLQIINTSFVVLTPTCRARVVLWPQKYNLLHKFFAVSAQKYNLLGMSRVWSFVPSWPAGGRYYLEIEKRRRAP